MRDPLPLASRTLYSSALVTVTDVVCSAGCGGARHEEWCDAATLAFVRSGTFVRRDRMGRHVADATRVVFFDPAEPYMVDHPVPGGDHCTSLRFDPGTLREAVRGAAAGRIFGRSTLAGNAELHLAHFRLLAAARSRDPVLVEEIALRLLQLCTEDEAGPLRGAAARRAAALAADAQVLIAASFSRRVTLEDLSRSLGVSPFRLCRAFRAANAGTLHQHLTQLRLAAALERLPAYRHHLTELALEVGFSSHSHFTHAFREYFGTSPSSLLHRRGLEPAQAAVGARRGR
ncbi:MAG TPA: helix-turn-helix transcriptional regulator [Myxococcales bacterium]